MGRRLLTVKQAAQLHPGITERTIRHLIEKSRPRTAWKDGKPYTLSGDGFFQRVCVKVGGRILIEETAFNSYLGLDRFSS